MNYLRQIIVALWIIGHVVGQTVDDCKVDMFAGMSVNKVVVDTVEITIQTMVDAEQCLSACCLHNCLFFFSKFKFP